MDDFQAFDLKEKNPACSGVFHFWWLKKTAHSGQCSPVQTASFTLFAEIRLESGASLVLPDEVVERGLFVCAGRADINGQAFASGTLVVLEAGSRVVVTAVEAGIRCMLMGGDALDGDRILEWNFVATERRLIEQAKESWRQRRYPPVPGDDEFIPLPD